LHVATGDCCSEITVTSSGERGREKEIRYVKNAFCGSELQAWQACQPKLAVQSPPPDPQEISFPTGNPKGLQGETFHPPHQSGSKSRENGVRC